MLAALLYLGSGSGLLMLRWIRKIPNAKLGRGEGWWLAGAVLSGGVIGPVLLMTGLATMPASGASLLLNAESVFTALLAWLVFQENVDRRIALGMLAIVSGAVVLSWPGSGTVVFESLWPGLAILGACLAWGIDNNLTRKVALTDASWIAMVKGLTAGATNLVIALALGSSLPAPLFILGATAVGFVSYGASLTLFVIALRHLGTARSAAYFSVAPFFGALLSVIFFKEPMTMMLLAGGALMALGVWLHLTEQHEHMHTHEALAHSHEHDHAAGDLHHDHVHDTVAPRGMRHTHWHRHEPLNHSHPHYPDTHHTHLHK